MSYGKLYSLPTKNFVCLSSKKRALKIKVPWVRLQSCALVMTVESSRRFAILSLTAALPLRLQNKGKLAQCCQVAEFSAKFRFLAEFWGKWPRVFRSGHLAEFVELLQKVAIWRGKWPKQKLLAENSKIFVGLRPHQIFIFSCCGPKRWSKIALHDLCTVRPTRTSIFMQILLK